MKKMILFLGLVATSFAGQDPLYLSPPYSKSQEDIQREDPLSDSSHLSESEKRFALQLSDLHRAMFCRHFSVAQRLRAIELSRLQNQNLRERKEELSPDEAVEWVMKEARQRKGVDSRYKPYTDSKNRNRKSTAPYRGRSNLP